MSNGKSFEIESMGVLLPKPVEIAELRGRQKWGSSGATMKKLRERHQDR